MTDHISDGRAWISNGTDYLKVFVEEILWTKMFEPELEHHEGGANIGFDLAKNYIIVKLQGIWLDTATKHDEFISYITSWQQANTLQIEVVRDGSSNKIKMDGTNTIFPVLIRKPGLVDITKEKGNQQVFKIGSIALEQRSTAS